VSSAGAVRILALACLNIGLWVLTPSTTWAVEKIDCVSAHEMSQQLWQRDLLVQSREQLLVCSDASCPALVQEDCHAWLSRVDKRLQQEASAARVSQNARQAREAVDQADDQHDRGCGPCGQNRPDRQNSGDRRDLQDLQDLQGLQDREDAEDREPRAGARSFSFLHTPAVPAAISLLALTSGAYFGLRGLSEAAELKRSCAPNCDADRVSAVRTRLMIADVSMVIGIGSAALAGWMIWNRSRTDAARTSDTAAGELSATASSSSFSLNYAGNF